jgi:hypothetical protein
MTVYLELNAIEIPPTAAQREISRVTSTLKRCGDPGCMLGTPHIQFQNMEAHDAINT